MKKSLYNNGLAHTPLARDIAHEAELFAQKMLDKLFKDGYSPREIEQVLCNGIQMKTTRFIIENRRSQLLEQGFDKPEDHEEYRKVKFGSDNSELPKGIAE